MSSAQAPLVGRNCWRKASAMFRVRQTPHAWLVYFGPGARAHAVPLIEQPPPGAATAQLGAAQVIAKTPGVQRREII